MLIESTRQALAIARNQIVPARITVREAVVAPPPVFGAKRIRSARAKLGFSQTVFARALNVSPATVRAWEQGSREPDGAAVRLLEIAAEYPRLLAAKVRHVSEAPRRYSTGRPHARSVRRK
ncbi:MAG: helix-turn-helix domain-containing protein [Gemmatimonadaceae bacterium]